MITSKTYKNKQTNKMRTKVTFKTTFPKIKMFMKKFNLSLKKNPWQEKLKSKSIFQNLKFSQ